MAGQATRPFRGRRPVPTGNTLQTLSACEDCMGRRWQTGMINQLNWSFLPEWDFRPASDFRDPRIDLFDM